MGAFVPETSRSRQSARLLIASGFEGAPSPDAPQHQPEYRDPDANRGEGVPAAGCPRVNTALIAVNFIAGAIGSALGQPTG
jgi:hypothetical protein